MKIHRIDHVGVVVNDLSAAKAFFLDFGLEAQGEGEFEGEWMDRVVGLNDVKTASVMLCAPDGQANIELINFIHRQVKKILSSLLQIPWVSGTSHLSLKTLKLLLPN